MKEVAVVGGSVAGLYVANKLAAAGAKVTVFERQPALDPEPRTLIVTSEMRSLLGPLGDSCVVNEIDRFELFADGKVASIGLAEPDLVIERSVLIQELARAAEGAGSSIRLGRRLAGLAPDSSGIAIRTSARSGDDPRTDVAQTIVGADGTHSRTARAAGWPQQPVVSLVQTFVDLPDGMDPSTTRIWFRPEETEYFFWLIPHSEKQGVLGLIGGRASSPAERLRRFAGEMNLAMHGYQAAVIPAYARWIPIRKDLGRGEVFLVGDAAGHVKVSTVGGIVTGLRGARAVANGILNGGLNGEVRPLKRELNAHLAIRRALNRFGENDYRSLIGHIDATTGSILGSINRDEAPRILLNLLRTRPQMILRGLRALVVGERR